MEPLIFADHLRRLRKTTQEAPRAKPPAFDPGGAARLVGAACAACLLLVMLQVAMSAPLAHASGPQLSALAAQEVAQ